MLIKNNVRIYANSNFQSAKYFLFQTTIDFLDRDKYCLVKNDYYRQGRLYSLLLLFLIDRVIFLLLTSREYIKQFINIVKISSDKLCDTKIQYKIMMSFGSSRANDVKLGRSSLVSSHQNDMTSFSLLRNFLSFAFENALTWNLTTPYPWPWP